MMPLASVLWFPQAQLVGVFDLGSGQTETHGHPVQGKTTVLVHPTSAELLQVQQQIL